MPTRNSGFLVQAQSPSNNSAGKKKRKRNSYNMYYYETDTIQMKI